MWRLTDDNTAGVAISVSWQFAMDAVGAKEVAPPQASQAKTMALLSCHIR